jgi:hypothetical protein
MVDKVSRDIQSTHTRGMDGLGFLDEATVLVTAVSFYILMNINITDTIRKKFSCGKSQVKGCLKGTFSPDSICPDVAWFNQPRQRSATLLKT